MNSLLRSCGLWSGRYAERILAVNFVRIGHSLSSKWPSSMTSTCSECALSYRAFGSFKALKTNSTNLNTTAVPTASLIDFNQRFSEQEEWKKELTETMEVHTNFITEEEEALMMKELEPYMSRLHYEDSHWDDAIRKYRETEKSRWKKENEAILNRVKSTAFPSTVAPMKLVHVLDLAKDGLIKPHIDSVRFCGNTIAGLSLLSSSVMRLRHEEKNDVYCDVLLPRYSLYIMKDFARYKFMHEILADSESAFRNSRVPRERRISVICRNNPPDPVAPTRLFEDVKPLPSE